MLKKKNNINNEDTINNLKLTLEHIEKRFGEGTIMLLGQNKVCAVDIIPSGSIVVDDCLGIGGFPRGRIVEIYGNEGCGKTTLALHCIGAVQRRGGKCAFVDCEHALDAAYVKNLKLDSKSLWVSQPDYGEQAIEIVDMLVKSGDVDVIVLDSVAALTPRAEIEGSVEDQLPGSQARLMSKALRKITGSISRSKAMVIFINQLRHKIGVIFGNPEVTSGGNALKFYSSIRIELRQGEKLKVGDNYVGTAIRTKIVKNKIAPPFKKSEFVILYGQGIDNYAEITTIALNRKVLQRKGSWIFMDDRKIGQGFDQVSNTLKEDVALLTELTKKLLASGVQSETLNDMIRS